MLFAPRWRKLTLAIHLAAAVGWTGAALAYLAVGIAAESTDSVETIRAAWLTMEIVGWFVIVPLGLVAFISGVVLAACTRWGLFRHYWVVFSLASTAFALVVLLQRMPGVGDTAEIARTAADRTVLSLGGDVVHPAIGVVILAVVLVLNLYKPRGLTATGRRQAQAAPWPRKSVLSSTKQSG